MDYHSPPLEQDTKPDYANQENKRDYKHSGPGIASFVIALLTLVCYAVTFVYVGAQASSLMNEHNKLIADSAETIMYLGLAMLILVAVNIIGTVTGIIGLTLRRRRKVFAVIGTIINAGFLLLFMLLLSVVFVNAGAS